MILGCVLECSSIAAMVYLTAVVVLTRIGVNKDLPDSKEPDPVQPAAAPRPPATPPRVDRKATPGEVAFMVAVLVGLVTATAALALVLSRWM